MERPSPTLAPRNLAGLLDETFTIYSRHLLGLIGLVALVQVPVNLASWLLFGLFGEGGWAITAAVALGLIGAVFVYGAGVYAVGQQYVTGMISIRDCYSRAWWRARSLSTIALILVAGLLFFLLVPTAASQSAMILLVLLMLLPAIAVAIYWTFGVQAVMVEGYKPLEALRRSYALVKGSWWRIFGITLVLWLVVTGLGIVVAILFALIAALAGFEVTSALGTALRFLASLLVEVVVPPIVVIAGTLLYYDMRVRKEKYDLATLSREMGIASA